MKGLGAQLVKGQFRTTKEVFLSAIAFGIVASNVQIIILNHTKVSYGTFNSVQCKSLWVVDDEGKTGILLAVNEEGGFLTVNGRGPDYRETVGISIGKSGGEVTLNGYNGLVTIEAGNGIHIYGQEGNITVTDNWIASITQCIYKCIHGYHR